MLVMYLAGGGRLFRDDGSTEQLPRLFVSGAVMEARRCRYAPGTLALTVMLRPGVVDTALGVAAEQIAGRNLALEVLLGREVVETFLTQIDAAREATEQVELFQNFLLATLKPARRGAVAEAFIRTRAKLFYPLVELSAQFGIGERTLERRVRRAFGISLRDLRRVMRFGLTLQRLGAGTTEWGDLTRVAQDAGYYDQAHMHREFLEFAGLPPLQLLKKIASDDPAYWVYRIAPEDFERLFLPGA